MEEFKYIFKKEKRKKERESRLWRSLEKYEVCFFFLGQGGGGGGEFVQSSFNQWGFQKNDL